MLKTLKKHIRHATALVRRAIDKHTSASKRSPQWRAFEKRWLMLHPLCEGCGGSEKLNAHHVIPFHLKPSRELREENLITLCMKVGRDCHIHLGHGNDFKAFNPNVRRDCAMARAAYQTNHMDAG